MIRTAIIEAGIVTNVVMRDPRDGWMPPEGCVIVASETAGVGDTWDGSAFTPPMPTAEQINRALRARLAETDARSIRPLRSILDAQAAGQPPDPADVSILAGLKAQADALRAELVV
ncbi:hypothetical protein H261_21004 [Paramagnetospirillum caucaseum]|uniref:Uncharacterized protein n=1 Tax=Paramagnetospirillum caucaseum TaxID=1244869 RepID=M2Y4A6_9PROT|nr:hypothetical protein [Paramagnetospirillum caucaseum]EME67921.1 hypothetical protein H261_21004 [Paramagnetospirillum caucaseum]